MLTWITIDVDVDQHKPWVDVDVDQHKKDVDVDQH